MNSIEDIKNMYADCVKELEIHESSHGIKLASIIVDYKKESCKEVKGVGTEIMNALIDYADSQKKSILLTPSKVYGSKSLSKLKEFYIKLGFVPNKGNNKNWYFQETMIRPYKGVNENMKDKIKRFINENLDFSGFKMNDTLNPIIWDEDMKMKEEISDALLQIAKDYFTSLKINIPVKDITMTGSLANYNWSKYSDVDLHIIIDLDKMGDKKDMVKDLLDAKTRAWNDKHDITVKGYDVELYLQPYDQEHFSTGVYSVLNDEWVIEPKIQDDTIDKKNVVKKYNSIVNTVNDIHKDFIKKKDYKDVVSRLESLGDKIKKTRTAGLEGKGEYSLENIVFKLLRRNNIMEKISNLLVKAYDESMSIDEELMNTIKEEDI
jgi:hypothetical protein